ncbi:MAG TPA: tellurium resistance protein TerC [Flavobacteriaceae bacterium]|nr:tellurium resistance protein TerC [Flavobacteriaceae bacterium]MCB9213171.1 tellurium resistance protein TerC [Alteromonas sp.]HPF10157.1 tellurium resistance protein TerC [Flavobacteriaceae bacterium]HQU21641.1 tellurium resistance protein TerC [Flavobacteriaceae bacterium]HQU65794.1 tellurium resistance protein TerC [Flavobacteriaceae bacterium]
MADLFTLENLVSLLLLILLQAVLGLDNLLYISIESKRAPEAEQKKVRTWGIGLAIILRIALLFVLVQLINLFKEPWWVIESNSVFDGSFNLHSIIILIGGIFIMYTAMKEIWHMMNLNADEKTEHKKSSVTTIIISIVLMNLVFSFDSILGAIALTDNFIVMATAIVIGGLLMIWLSGHVTEFLKKNRMYEVLGLFILLIVGVMLLSEGAHLAHMHIFNNAITAMSKSTFYFVIVVLILIDIVQSRYQKKINRGLD